MSFKKTMTNNINTQTTRSAFSSEANPQPTHMTKVFKNSYLFRDLNEYINLWNLSITCKIFSESKKYLRYKLNRRYSGMYYFDRQTKNMILEKVFNPQKQLSLDLSRVLIDINADALGEVHTLNLEGCLITDVRPLINVHTLNLSNCYRITDISPLKKVHTLYLSYCDKITEFSPLRNVHTLNLTGCIQITDVSIFKNVYNLNLSYTKIIDVRALGKVHTLDLSYCYYIKNVDALGNVKILLLPYHLK